MTTAYQHKPLSSILVPQADSESKATSEKEPPAEKDQLPEKYRGKSVEEVIEMHQNAEKRLGALSNELGTMRGIVTDLSRITRPQPEPTTEDEEELAVSGDELLADPVSAVRKVVKRDLDRAKLEREEKDLEQAAQSEANRLIQEYGDIGTIVATDEFQEFVSRTDFRKRDLQAAASGSGMDQVNAARRLMEDFADYQKTASPSEDSKEDTPVSAARKAQTEGGGSSAKVSSKTVFHESDVLKVIQDDPGKWRSPSYQNEILTAIREGRYIKSS